jgi:hypothetical protein
LFDSNPEEEEAETELKASAMLSAIRDARLGNAGSGTRETAKVGEAPRSCWSTTRTPSFTRWQTISARPAPR